MNGGQRGAKKNKAGEAKTRQSISRKAGAAQKNIRMHGAVLLIASGPERRQSPHRSGRVKEIPRQARFVKVLVAALT